MRFGTRAIALITISLTTISFIPSSSAAGRSASAAVNTILNGKGAPKSATGIDGDFYIDTRSLLLYGPKAKGKWPTPQSIQGPTGPSGSDGRNGSDGKSASAANIASVSGPQGPQGVPGEKGEKGDPGLPGANGAPGPAGPAGASGPSGPPGGSGANGAQGPAGPTGATGPQGPAGAKGETGTAGSSEVVVIDIPTWTLGSATPFSYSSSALIGSLLANSSYSFQIHIHGTSAFNSLVLGLDVISSGSTLNFSYSRNDFRYATYSATPTKYGFDVVGTIKTLTSDTALQVRVIDGFGDSGSNPLTLSGKAYITLVGAIR